MRAALSRRGLRLDERADARRRGEAELLGGGRGEVPGHALGVGPAVDDRDEDARAAVGDLDERSARQRLVRDANEVLREGLAAGGLVAVQAGAVPGGHAGLE